MKVFLFVSIFLGLLVTSVLTIEAVDHYQKTQVFEAKEREANNADAITVYETAVLTLNEVRIPVANYVRNSEGNPSISLLIPNQSIIVKKGDVFEVE